MSTTKSDSNRILDNEAGPVRFRTNKPNVKLSVSGPGTLQSWTGQGWDVGVVFAESSTITSPGTFQITLDSAGYASINET